MSGLWGSSGEVACGIDSVLRLIRFFAEQPSPRLRLAKDRGLYIFKE